MSATLGAQVGMSRTQCEASLEEDLVVPDPVITLPQVSRLLSVQRGGESKLVCVLQLVNVRRAQAIVRADR